MAHAAQRRFCREVKERFPEFFHQTRVLEIGSRNINGSLRELFSNSEKYVGVDVEPGPDVDIVCLGHEYAALPESFDVVCSAEAFEHDPYASRTIHQMLRYLRPGGLFFMTCAGEGRPEHGTSRTGKCYGPQSDFYRNVTVRDFQEWAGLREDVFPEHDLRHNAHIGDLYFWGIKRK
ncbi:MAG: hypothetical protein Tsb009_14450 [Planctomycetaceae bacterium]